jgi:hypothetical protein
MPNNQVRAVAGCAPVTALAFGTEGADATFVDAANPLPVAPTGTVAVAQTRILTASFTRPADTTAYASGDLVANSTTAGSVVPLSFTMNRVSLQGGMIRRVRIRKTGTSITNASFRIHLYTAAPIASNGDNGAFLTDKAANYVGKLDVTCDQAFTDGASGNGTPVVGSEINYRADTYYALIEGRGAYTPVSGEVFTVELEVIQN